MKMPVCSNLKIGINWLGGFHRCSQPPPQPPFQPPTWPMGCGPRLAGGLSCWPSKVFGIWVDPYAYENIWHLGPNMWIIEEQCSDKGERT